MYVCLAYSNFNVSLFFSLCTGLLALNLHIVADKQAKPATDAQKTSQQAQSSTPGEL
jgi:hypothetical protein